MTRTRIDDQRRNGSFSLRSKQLKLTLEKGYCPQCHHDRIFENMTYKYCTRCKCKI